MGRFNHMMMAGLLAMIFATLPAAAWDAAHGGTD